MLVNRVGQSGLERTVVLLFVHDMTVQASVNEVGIQLDSTYILVPFCSDIEHDEHEILRPATIVAHISDLSNFSPVLINNDHVDLMPLIARGTYMHSSRSAVSHAETQLPRLKTAICELPLMRRQLGR